MQRMSNYYLPVTCPVFRLTISRLSRSPEKKHDGTDGLAAFVAMW